jgi:hypothetical protein
MKPTSMRLRRPSPALIVASVALFVALSGGAYAASQLVGTKQLKNGAVTSAKVRDGSLLAKDFKAGQLRRGKRGARGPKGDPGPVGPTGPAGASPFLATAGSDASLRCASWCYLSDQPGAAVLSLDSPPSPHVYQSQWSSTGHLDLTRPARVFINASLSYTTPSGATGQDANCYLRDASTGKSFHPSVYLRPGADIATSATLTAVDTLAAGTHNIQIWCFSYGAAKPLAVTAAGMTVFAVAG